MQVRILMQALMKGYHKKMQIMTLLMQTANRP